MPQSKPKAVTGRIRDDIVALFKPDSWLKKAEISQALGVSADLLTFHLGKLIADQDLIATGSTSNRAFALPGTTPPEAPDKPSKVKAKTRKAAPKQKAAPKATVHVHTGRGHILATIENLIARREMIDAALTALRAL